MLLKPSAGEQVVSASIKTFITSVGHQIRLSPIDAVLPVGRADRGVNNHNGSRLQDCLVLGSDTSLIQVNAGDVACGEREEVAEIDDVGLHG
jgi:hypothetical protein